MTSDPIQIVSVNISEEKGTVKHPVGKAVIDENGIIGDAHAGTTNRLISLLSQESVERFAGEIGREVAHGEFAENLTTRGMSMGTVRHLDRFRIGEVELEVTQIGKKCHGDNCAIFREVGRCVMPKEGIFCRVIHGGIIEAGDAIEYIPKQLRVKIITVSDRASRGEYVDRSGARARDMIGDYLREKNWHSQIETQVVPDEPDKIREELRRSRDEFYEVVFTTGGTGVGPRDITPDIVIHECEKMVPGIMEHIRMKFAAGNPNALLSRGVAGVMGNSLVFTLPGSVKAVEEYMGEILRLLEHMILMLHGLDVHKT